MGDEEPPEKKRKKWSYDNGEYYGDVENGKRHGQGTYTWTTGDKFKGKWEAGIRNGVGFLKYTKGTKYEGQWKNDEPEGRGIITWSHGIHFKGIFSGWKHAEGELTVLSDDTRLLAELNDGVWKIKVPNTILKRNEYSIWQVPANIHERALLREREKRKSW